MNNYQLNSGLDLYVVGSALQKALRRSEIEQSLYFARELEFEGHANYVWKRLFLSCLEDVGLASIEVLPEVYGMYKSYLQIKEVKKVGKKLSWLVLTRAIHLICDSTKNLAAYKAAIWIEDQFTPLDVKGKANILSLFDKNCHDKDEQAALNTMFNYMKKHRIQGIFEKMLEFSLVNCHYKVSNYISIAQEIYREMLNKGKYQMPFLTIMTMLLVRAVRHDKTINEYARKSIKGAYSFDIPDYAHDQTVGGYYNKESDRAIKEVVYKLDYFYHNYIKTKYVHSG